MPPTARGPLTAEERALLERLVGEWGPRLLAYVRRVYGSPQEAEDIVAETFCRAAHNIAALRASQRQHLYLLTVARNLCRDRFRSRGAGAHVDPLPPELLDVHAAHAVGPPPTALASSEQLRALRAAVAGLPEHLREVVVLRLSTDLRFEDIAALLSIPLGTALSRMHAALQHLRENLDEAHEP